MNKKLLLNLLVGIVFLFGGLLFCQKPIFAAATDNVHGWAWSDTIGWISFNCTEGGASQNDICSTSSYGVNIDPNTGIFSGYAWSDNIGWISFNQADLTGCPSGSCSAQVDLDTGSVTGWAKALNSTGADYGWIRLNDAVNGYHQVQINPTTGYFSDYAWGGGPIDAAVIGWISFNCSNEAECATSDYYVWTDPDIFNKRPYITNIDITEPTPEDFCNDTASYFLHWTFMDDDTGAYEKTYQLKIINTGTNASSTYSPGIYSPGTIPSGTNQSLGVPVRTTESLDASPPQVTHGQTYAWQVRVQDDKDAWSDWESGIGFSVPEEYPECDFAMDPAAPRIGQTVSFTDTSTPGSYPIISWFWDFGDGTSTTTQNPTHIYYEVAPRTITLTITDSAGRSCSDSMTVNIRPGRPEWDEVIPR